MSLPRTAGGGAVTPGGTAAPTFNIPSPPGTTIPLYGSGGLTPGGMGPGLPNTQNSKDSLEFSITTTLISLALLLVIVQPM
ncbi:unnamed protein product [Ilex paraguariensis]|uniref:Uncharacterized protein n=1 Tax=Ilex paraguariensis TaxID=185542 RepID=A0ABC8RB41_9AQUA